MHGLRSANSRKIAGKTESLLRHTHSFHRVRERLIRVCTREGAKIARHRDEPDGLTWQGRLSCSDGWPVAGQPDVSRISRELHFCPRRFRPLSPQKRPFTEPRSNVQLGSKPPFRFRDHAARALSTGLRRSRLPKHLVLKGGGRSKCCEADSRKSTPYGRLCCQLSSAHHCYCELSKRIASSRDCSTRRRAVSSAVTPSRALI